MNNKFLLTAVAVAAMVPSVWAVSYDQNITAIFGSGNPNTGWTTETGSGITLGLRGKDRVTASTANASGVYSYAAGTVPPANNRAKWNWEFSINSGTAQLSSYDFFVGIDTDASAGINYTYVNALSYWNDNSYGTAATLNGQGVEGLASALAGTSFIAQQSQNLVFAPAGGNPLLDATYNYELFAVAKGGSSSDTRLASVGIKVIVGAGGAAVPDAGSTLTLLGMGMAGLVGLNFRKRK